jgi:hypothetical protein
VIESIDDGRRERSSLQPANAGFGKMSIQRWPPAETKFAEFEQFLPHGRDIGSVRFERLTESNCDRVWDPLRKFPEKSSTLKRKIEPQSWSSQTGTTAALAWRAMSS